MLYKDVAISNEVINELRVLVATTENLKVLQQPGFVFRRGKKINTEFEKMFSAASNVADFFNSNGETVKEEFAKVLQPMKLIRRTMEHEGTEDISKMSSFSQAVVERCMTDAIDGLNKLAVKVLTNLEN
jgi:hypothetical protein